MTVYLVFETRNDHRQLESIWPSFNSARFQVDLILRTKPRPELWGQFSMLNATWTDGHDSIHIEEWQIRKPGMMHTNEEVGDDMGSQVCNKR